MLIITIPGQRPDVLPDARGPHGGCILYCSLCGQELARWWGPVLNRNWLPPEFQDRWTAFSFAITDKFLPEYAQETLHNWPAPVLRAFFLHSIDEAMRVGLLRPRTRT